MADTDTQVGPQAESGAAVSVSADDSSRHPGAFFPGGQNFVVAGGQFTNNIFNPPPNIPSSDFRVVPLGDLDLRNEIRLDDSKSGVVHKQYLKNPVRRIYTARIDGRQSDMTVAVYQGPQAEENWKREIQKYSMLRHPSFVQLYGTVRSACGLYATIFHDELVPFQQYMDEYRHSMISTVYLHMYFSRRHEDAEDQLASVVGPYKASEIIYNASAAWIRRSTGRLCVQPWTEERIYRSPFWASCKDVPPMSSLAGDPEHAMLSSLSLSDCHAICFDFLGVDNWLDLKQDVGEMILSPETDKIAHVLNPKLLSDGWEDRPKHVEEDGRMVLENGWTRFASSCAKHPDPLRGVLYIGDRGLWLSQANYIFGQAGITSNHANYYSVCGIFYELTVSPPQGIISEGYLFLCPLEDLRTEDGKFVERSECPAYWSRDPSGSKRLTPEAASSLGFPFFKWQRRIWAKSWEERVYIGISQFHAAKGFDPNSQDVARHLGFPLYELYRDPSPDGAHIEEIFPGDWEGSAMDEDEPPECMGISEMEVDDQW
ncbi:hypothetical protein B0H11DRAFT_2102129 [Mycena galericulata]|nr:hypothetical protein B0H11DRAFT_2102129 [Mycena galericulata]